MRGYEIHHGRSSGRGDPALLATTTAREGCGPGAVLGTHWHGLLENDGFRRALLRAGRRAGRARRVRAPHRTPSFAAERAAQLDLLGDLIEEHLDTDALEHVVGHGALTRTCRP